MAPLPEYSHNGVNSPESLLLGEKITLIPERVRAANPETYINTDAPPFLIQHGDRDDTVPYQQSVNMAAKLASVLGEEKVRLDILKNARHGDPAFSTPENLRKVFGFLEQCLK